VFHAIHPLDIMDDAVIAGTSKFKHYNTQAPDTKRILPLFSLKGKTAIVAGAGAGIGLAVVRGYAEAGANVVIWFERPSVTCVRD
jgi:FlaA1/EpsC-like NDP-sugar epimerase